MRRDLGHLLVIQGTKQCQHSRSGSRGTVRKECDGAMVLASETQIFYKAVLFTIPGFRSLPDSRQIREHQSDHCSPLQQCVSASSCTSEVEHEPADKSSGTKKS